jgi:hypothetical protein
MTDTAKQPMAGTITADAIYVHEQTGVTPRQLLEQRDELQERVRELEALLDTIHLKSCCALEEDIDSKEEILRWIATDIEADLAKCGKVGV